MNPDIQKTIWDRKQIKRIGGHYSANQHRLDRIAREIRKRVQTDRTTTKVLNVGIGNGYLEEKLANEGFDIFSLDPSQNAVSALTERLELARDKIRVGSADDIPFPSEFFEFVVMSEVIEHLDQQLLESSLGEIKRVLTNNGYLIGTCPDNENLDANSFTCPYCGKRSHRVGHVHTFTTAKLQALLEQYFRVDVCVTFRGMFLNWKGFLMHHYVDLPFKIARMFRKNLRVPHQIHFNILFIVKKLP